MKTALMWLLLTTGPEYYSIGWIVPVDPSQDPGCRITYLQASQFIEYRMAVCVNSTEALEALIVLDGEWLSKNSDENTVLILDDRTR